MGADEQEDDSGGSEVLEDVLLPFGSWDEIAVIPVANEVLVSQIAQVDGQFIAEFAIFVGVGDKNIEWHALLQLELMSVAVIIILRNAAFVTKGSMNANQTWGGNACHPGRSEGSGSRAARSFAALRMTEGGKDDRWREG